MTPLVSVRDLAVQIRGRQVFRGVTFDLRAGQTLGVVGANGAGKSVLLRTIAGNVHPSEGDTRIDGRPPRYALARTPTAYFAGEATLPGFARAASWGNLGTGTALTAERRRIRALPRSGRQLLGLRTELGRHPLSLILLDEPWDGLDPDGVRWLNATLEAKRDRGAAIVLSTRRLDELAGLCDMYLFLTPAAPFLFRAQDIEHDGRITPARLLELFEVVRNEPSATIARPRHTLPP